MKRKTSHIREIIAQWTALLLLSLFISLPAIPLFHTHHEEDQLTMQHERESFAASEHCDICQFLANFQHSDYLCPVQEPMLLPLLPSLQHLSGVFTGNYKFTLQGFTNKGPPIAIS